MLERDRSRAGRCLQFLLAGLALAAAPGVAQTPPSPLWTQQPPIGAFQTEHCYVDASGGLVALGYKGRGLRSWRYDQGWSEILTEQPPEQVWRAAYAYDEARQRLVMFGGRFLSSLDVTFEFDGSSWANPIPATTPPRRMDAAMAYDPVLQRVVLCGGVDEPWNGPAVHYADTWDFDGATWTQRTAHNAPRLEAGSPMVFDTTLQQLLLVGRPVGAAHVESWTYDGQTWRRLLTSSVPPRAAGTRMAHDPVAQQTVLFVGQDFGGGGPQHETWSFDGFDWSLQAVGDGPRGFLGRDLTWSAALGGLVCVGGSVASPYSARSGAIVRYAGGVWSPLTSEVPFVRYAPHAVFDSNRGCLVLHGGTDERGHPSLDTFEWRPATGWQQTAAGVGPGRAMVYDAARQKVVAIAAGQTWEYDAAGWTAVAYAGTPTDGVLWYDRSQAAVRAASGNLVSTQSTNGPTPIWYAQTTSGTSLPTGELHASYWGAHDMVVAVKPFSTELYQFSGNAWDQRTVGWQWPSNVTEVPTRGEVLIGGRTVWGSFRFVQPWTPGVPWNVGWHLQLSPSRPHEAVIGGAWATDGASGDVYAVGPSGEVSTLSWPGNPSVTRLEAGCGYDTLELLYPTNASQMPPAWLGGVLPLLLTGIDPSPGLVMLALGPSYGSATNVLLPISLTPVGIPNCVAWSTLDVLLPYAHTGSGLVINLPMPSDPNFAGVPFAVQAFLPPSTSSPWARVTDALLITAY